MTALVELRPRRAAAFGAFRALLGRDLAVLRKELPIFVVRTVMQPLLLLFVFTYVFPRIGQAVGGRAPPPPTSPPCSSPGWWPPP